jgi:hypothetical protein
MRCFLSLALLLCAVAPALAAAPEEQPRLAPVDADGSTFRLSDGFTLLVHNPEGKPFSVGLDVRDLNLLEPGARDVLFKVYDPTGKAVVREVIPDDGVTTPAGQGPTGGWDHEGWYYLYHYNRGVAPMLRWTALGAPDRLAAVPVRSFTRSVPAGPKGVYRVVVVGCRDHVVTAKIGGGLKWGVGGNPFFLHPVGNLLDKRFVYVPKGTTGLAIALVEHDHPRSRRFTLKDEAGNLLASGDAHSGVGFAEVKLEAQKPQGPAVPAHLQPGAWDGRVLTLEVAPGPNACMVQFSLFQPKLEGLSRPLPPPVVPAFYAADPETARALGGGAITVDGRTYWQPLQARLDAWVRGLKPEDFLVKNPDGSEAKLVDILPPEGGAKAAGLDVQPNRNAEFRPLNGVHERAPLADSVMFSYDLNRNRQALNVAIRDTVAGLADIGPGDHVLNATWKGMANLAYENGTYRFHWWRPAWRIVRQADTPPEVRDAMRELILHTADRIAFCNSWERVNGNAFTTLLCALRYAQEATGDPLTKRLCDTFHDRLTTGGFGDRVGVGPSGPVQEEFAYDNHYGSYVMATTGAVARDIDDPRFPKIRDGIQNFFSYTTNPEVSACPFSARTNHNPAGKPATEGPFAWKGLPGPDLTESINGANEFFAARRPKYYVLSYHGRITPKWQCESFNGQMGWSGGVMCQFVVPGKGTVLASTLDPPGYGTNMHPTQWRSFRLNSIVGTTTDGKPLVAADCHHMDARLEGNTVTGSGEVRDSSVHATRSYTYNPDHVVVEAKLRMTDDDGYQAFWFQSPFRGCIAEAWEMIPFVATKAGAKNKADPASATVVKVLDAAGREVGALGVEPSTGQVVVIDRGGFGVRIELEKPMEVKRGAGDTVMIKLLDGMPPGPRDPKAAPNAEQAAIRYKIVPFSS